MSSVTIDAPSLIKLAASGFTFVCALTVATWRLIVWARPHVERVLSLWSHLLADVATIKAQWLPNGGSSPLDKIDRLDQQLAVEIATRQLTETRAIWEGEVALDGTVRTVSLSREYQRLTGLTADDIDNGGWMRGVAPEDRERVARIAAHAHTEEALFQAEYHARHIVTGARTWVEHVGKPICDSRRKVRRWVGLMTVVSPPPAPARP